MNITFPSISDAKLGAFVLGGDWKEKDFEAVANVFDTLVKIICEPDFNAGELRLKTFREVASHAARERGRIVSQKASTTEKGTDIPSVVLERVFDVLGDITLSMIHRIQEEAWQAHTSYRDIAQAPCFRTLSRFLKKFSSVPLVNSTWNTFSCHVFGKYANLCFEEHDDEERTKGTLRIFKAISSSMLGGWTQYAGISVFGLETAAANPFALTESLLVGKLGHVKHLSICVYCEDGEKEPKMDHLANIVTSLTSLETFQLDFTNEDPHDRITLSFLSRIQLLPHLKRLRIFFYDFFTPENHAALLARIEDFPRLQEFSLQGDEVRLDGTQVWTRWDESSTHTHRFHLRSLSVLNANLTISATKARDDLESLLPSLPRLPLVETDFSQLKRTMDLLFPLTTNLCELKVLHSEDIIDHSRFPNFAFNTILSLPSLRRIFLGFRSRFWDSQDKGQRLNEIEQSMSIMDENLVQWIATSNLPSLEEMQEVLTVRCPFQDDHIGRDLQGVEMENLEDIMEAFEYAVEKLSIRQLPQGLKVTPALLTRKITVKWDCVL